MQCHNPSFAKMKIKASISYFKKLTKGIYSELHEQHDGATLNTFLSCRLTKSFLAFFFFLQKGKSKLCDPLPCQDLPGTPSLSIPPSLNRKAVVRAD